MMQLEKKRRWDRLAQGWVGEATESRLDFIEDVAVLLGAVDPAPVRLLEAGCGTGVTGLGLAGKQFRVDLLDFSPEMLGRAREIWHPELGKLDYEPRFLHADLMNASPAGLRVEPYDCVFNAGVLEHYSDGEAVQLLEGMARLSRRYVLAIVPNSRCAIYRWWRWRLMRSQEWPYGSEIPSGSLAHLMEKAGLEPLIEAPIAHLAAMEIAREVAGKDGDLLEWLSDDDLPDEVSCYLVACLARVEEGQVERHGPSVEDLALRTQRLWLERLRAEHRRLSRAIHEATDERLANEDRARGLFEERLRIAERAQLVAEEKAAQFSVGQGLLEKSLETAEEARLVAEEKAGQIRAEREALEKHLQAADEARSIAEKKERDLYRDWQTADRQRRRKITELETENRAVAAAQRAEADALRQRAEASQEELEGRIAELERGLTEVRSSLGYRLLLRLRRWRNRLLFLSATHVLRPTFKNLMEGLFCWPWRAVLPRSVMAILDGRQSDPDFSHHRLKVFSRRPEAWQKRNFRTVDTSATPPRRVRVSLIATVLDEEGNVERWLKSIARQSRRPDELIVVDGGSSDKTVEVLRRESRSLPFEVSILRQPGSNIAQGRNVALRQACHEFVAVTDAGCEITPRWLEELVAPFEFDERVDGVIGWCEIHPDSSWGRRRSWLLLAPLEATDPKRLLPSSRSFAFRKAFGLRLGGYPEHLTKWGEDTLFCLNLTGLGARWAFAPEAVTLWNGPGSWRQALRLRRNYQLGNGEARIFLGSMGGTAREVLTLGTLAISAVAFAGAATFLPGLLWVGGACALLSLAYLSRAGLTRWAIDKSRSGQTGGRGSPLPIFQAWAMGVADTVGALHGLWRSRGRIVRRVLDPKADTIVFLQTHEWFWMKQRLGHLAESFAARGLQVVYLPRNLVEQTHGGLLPVPGGIALCNDPTSLRCLRRPVVYSAAAHHFSSGRAGFLRRARRILDLADLPGVVGSTGEDLAATGSADLVYAASESLAQLYRDRTGRSAALLRNGVSCDHWRSRHGEVPADLRPLVATGKKIVGYIGALGWWVDFGLLATAARSRPEWRFVLIGPVFCDETAAVIEELPANVNHLGVKPHAELPAYVKSFDAGIIPFVVGKETRASNPIKLYEYAAMELPIVSADLPECRHVEIVHIARSAEEFVQCLARAMLEREDPEARRRLREFATRNTWQQRAQVVLADLGLADRYADAMESRG